MNKIYDVAIIGGGPAGLTAGIYASRARLKAILIEKALCGGQILITDRIENYPGFPDGITGPDLADWMKEQAERFGLEFKTAEVAGIALKKDAGSAFSVKIGEPEDLKALSIIIASGARWNSLGIPGEAEFTGKGVSYCATCDGPLFRNKDVVVVGGGDTALEDGMFLSKFANKVTIVHRRDRLRATKILQERALANKKISFCLDSTATEIAGQGTVKGLKVKNVKTGSQTLINCDGIFILVGITPNSDIVKAHVKTDEKGYIITDNDMATSIEGIFAAGDVRKKALRQVVTATGEGAQAAFSAEHYISRMLGTEYK